MQDNRKRFTLINTVSTLIKVNYLEMDLLAYNDAVLKYKNKLEMFPSNIIAGMFGFKPEPFFEATEKEKETPQVKF